MILYLFYFLAFLQLLFSWRSLAGGFSYLRFFREQIGRELRAPRASASVIVPCKGRDKGFEENIAALFGQDFGKYELIFVIDSENDPARKPIERLMANNDSVGSRLTIAGKASDTGQKIHNLIEAARSIDENPEVIVFVDSDARPSADWLARLVSAAVSGNGVASGYRWFIPERGGLASELRSAWNASIASVLGPDEKSNFSWGGSTAITRNLFEELEVAKNWKGKLADDFALTKMLNDRGIGVRFVPSCLTASVEDCTIAEMLEFTTRQMKITRVYRPDLWAYSLIGSVLYLLTSIWALILIFAGDGPQVWLAGGFLAVVALFGTAKAWLRLKAVRLALPEHLAAIRRQTVWQLTLWAVTPLIYLYNDIAALLSRRIVWRGVEYELESADVTRIVNRNG